ncbi:MAG: hypothetical protein C0424_10425 [Sphingobacteriaceae bacterium]|nr:hypothetical protein [Sphingobacteriaceae bacterium]
MLKLGNALALMHSTDALGAPARFQVKYVTYSTSRKNGGKLVELADVTISSLTRTGLKSPGKKKQLVSPERNPMHDYHQTINFQLADGTVHKAHRCLIVEFNKTRVII